MKHFSLSPPRSISLGLAALFAAATVYSSVSANTAGYWRFEEGTAGTPVSHGERDGSIGEDAVVDSSGNGNHLRAWDANSAPLYVGDVPFDPVPQTGEPNELALQFAPGRDLLAEGKPINTHEFDSWTIEVSFKTDRVDVYQQIVGKDGNPIGGPPPVFVKVLAHNSHLEVGVVDGEGIFQTVLSDVPLVPNEWYSVAATATEWALSLWIKGPGDPDYVLQFETAFLEGAFLNTYENFNRPWMVGRGMWNGAMVDWFRGTIDEVRISDRALNSWEFLGAPDSDSVSDSTLAYWRFEEGTEGERVPAPPVGADVVIDASGSGNDMRTANEGSAPTYVDDVPFSPVPQTGATNNLALSFTPNRDIFTDAKPINSLEFDELTIEASFKANVTEAWQVIVGKDGQALQQDQQLHHAPPFMLKTMGPGGNAGRLEAALIDSTRAFHSVLSLGALVPGEWYSAAVTATATELAFYLKGPGDEEYVLQGTTGIQGAFTGPGDYLSPEEFNRPWTIGRGMWAGGMADWFNGTVDEARISTVALDPSQFLASAGAPPFDPADLEVRAVIVERTVNGTPRLFLAVETWDAGTGSLQLQASPDLGDWQDTPFTSETIEPFGGPWERLRLTSELAVDDHSRHFLRVAVEP